MPIYLKEIAEFTRKSDTERELGDVLAGRSHSLHKVFTQLYNKDELPEKYSKYSDTLRKWVSTEKIKAQYQGQTYSQSDMDRAIKQTRRYLNKCVKPVLREQEVIE